MPMLYKTFKTPESGALMQNSKVVFEYAGEEIKDAAIFGAYDYGNTPDSFLLHPYDFFALNVNIEVDFATCDYEFATGARINCIDNSKL